jgi:hypothetical protein
MAAANRIVPCKELFKNFNILPLASKLFFSLLSFVVDRTENFQTNLDTYPEYKKYIYIYNLHVPNTNLKEFTILELSYSINFQLISEV